MTIPAKRDIITNCAGLFFVRRFSMRLAGTENVREKRRKREKNGSPRGKYGFYESEKYKTRRQNGTMKKDVVIIGAGPAGIFTALEMLRRGSKKSILIVEKGKSVENRRCPKT